MEKIRYRLVHNRCKRAAEGEYALVQIEAYLGGRKIYMKTNVYVKPEQWDKQRKEVVNHPLANDLNAFLFDKIICLQQVELAIWKRGVQPTLSMIKEAAAKNRIPATNFIQFAKQSIEMSAKRPGTKENLMSTVKILSEEHPHLQFDELTFGFVREFEARLKQRGLAVNTVAKHLRQLRTMVNEAISSDYIEQDAYPFRRFRIKHEKAEHTHLTYDELEKLERTEPKGKRASGFCVLFFFVSIRACAFLTSCGWARSTLWR